MDNEIKSPIIRNNIKLATKNLKQVNANIKSTPNSVKSNIKKEFILEGLGCANCAAKLEQKLNDLDGIKSASINFVTKTLFLEIEEINKTNELIAATKDIVKSVESDVELKEKQTDKVLKKTLILDGLG